MIIVCHSLLGRIGIISLGRAPRGSTPSRGYRDRNVEQNGEVGATDFARETRHPVTFRFLGLVGE